MGIQHILQVPTSFVRKSEWCLVQFSPDNKLNVGDLNFVAENHEKIYRTRLWGALGIVSLAEAGFVLGFGAGINHTKLAQVAVDNKLTPSEYKFDNSTMHAQAYQEDHLPCLIDYLTASRNLMKTLLASVESSCSSDGQIFVYEYTL